MKKTIKICFISPSAYPLFNPDYKITFGGAEVDTYFIAKELSKDKRFSVIFVTADFGQKPIEIYDKVTLFKGHILKENKIISAIKLFKILKKINADIYFQESANAGTGLVRFVSKLKNKKFVYRTASEVDCNGEFIKKHFMEGIFFKYGIKKADSVITQNKRNKDQLLETINVKSSVIKNAISLENQNLNKHKYILWVARSAKLKRPDLFLELVKNFPEEDFIMICPKANENDDNSIELNAKNLKNLKFIRFVEFSKINDYFRDAKLFINTSDYEGFPNTFVQATQNSAPIISLNVNPDNFLDKYGCGFCAKGNFETMKKQIKILISDNKLFKKMAKNAYDYAHKNHDIKNIIKQYKKEFLRIENKK